MGGVDPHILRKGVLGRGFDDVKGDFFFFFFLVAVTVGCLAEMKDAGRSSLLEQNAVDKLIVQEKRTNEAFSSETWILTQMCICAHKGH